MVAPLGLRSIFTLAGNNNLRENRNDNIEIMKHRYHVEDDTDDDDVD